MLKGLAFLNILNDPDVEWLVANSQRRTVPSGTALIRQDEPVEFLYLIVDGTFSVTVSIPREHQVARLYSGELVGEMSFVGSQAPSATVTAAQDSSVLAITRANLIGKIEQDIGFAARFYKGISVLLADRLRDADNGAYLSDIDLFPGTPKYYERDELARSQMDSLARRFEEIQRRLELRRAQGA